LVISPRRALHSTSTLEALEVLAFRAVAAHVAAYPSLCGLPEHMVVGLLEVRSRAFTARAPSVCRRD
jgi:hypothetical protein